MKPLTSLLPPKRLQALRAAYDHDAMIRANVGAVATMAPALGRWNDEIGRTFYDPSGPLAPPDRERCLITLTVSSGLSIPTAVHVYWGLMEGLSVDEIAQIVGLVGCYGGLPRCSFGLDIVSRTLALLGKVGPDRSPGAVLAALIKGLSAK